MRGRARQRADRAHAAAHEPVDVVREIGEAILAGRRAEVGDVDVEAGGRDVARERAAGQEIDDEVAAHGRRHEQHRRLPARGLPVSSSSRSSRSLFSR